MYSQEQVHTNVVQLNCTSTEGQFPGINPTGNNFSKPSTFSTCLQRSPKGKTKIFNEVLF